MIPILGKICDRLGLSFNFLNRDNSPSNRAVIKESSTVGVIQQAGGNIHNNITIAQAEQSRTRPQIDVDQWGGSGGPNGTFIRFYLKNIGSETAVDVQAELIADDCSGSIKLSSPIHNIPPMQLSRSLQYRYDGTDFFKRMLTKPRVILRYKSADNRAFASGRSVIQEPRADKRYNIHTKPPVSYFDGEPPKGED